MNESQAGDIREGIILARADVYLAQLEISGASAYQIKKHKDKFEPLWANPSSALVVRTRARVRTKMQARMIERLTLKRMELAARGRDPQPFQFNRPYMERATSRTGGVKFVDLTTGEVVG